MPNNSQPTPDRLPKPIDEMTADEIWALFPDNKPYIGERIGESEYGPIIAVSEGLMNEMVDLLYLAENE